MSVTSKSYNSQLLAYGKNAFSLYKENMDEVKHLVNNIQENFNIKYPEIVNLLTENSTQTEEELRLSNTQLADENTQTSLLDFVQNIDPTTIWDMLERYYNSISDLEKTLIKRISNVIDTTLSLSPSVVKPQQEAIERVIQSLSDLHLQYQSTLSLLGPPININGIDWVTNTEYQSILQEQSHKNKIEYNKLNDQFNKLKLQYEMCQKQIQQLMNDSKSSKLNNNNNNNNNRKHNLSYTMPTTISFIPSLSIQTNNNNSDNNTDKNDYNYLLKKLDESKRIIQKNNSDLEQYQTMEQVLMDSLTQKSERIAELERDVNRLLKEINVMRSAGLMSTEDDNDDYNYKDDSSKSSWNFFSFFS